MAESIRVGRTLSVKTALLQFVLNPTKKVIGQDTRELIDKLLLEKIPPFRNC
jgi:hypothetical protein